MTVAVLQQFQSFETYLLADPIESKVTVCTLSEGFYGNQVFSGDQPIGSPTFPRLELTADQILRAGR
jgi:Uma2 family endonuclease